MTLFSSLALFIYYAKDLPRPEKFTEQTFAQSTKIYDKKGETLLYEISGDEKRTLVKLSDISPYMKQAILATEDSNFYNHHGIDFKGIFRSVVKNLRLRRIASGGSTIDQQLIRSTFFYPERSIKRKVREIILSLELDRRYPKDQIFEWYLNEIPFGLNIYGIEAASQTYFSTSSKDLSLAQSAILAALIKAPSYYTENKDALMTRKNYVLDRMEAEHFITAEQKDEAKEQEITLERPLQKMIAPHFVLNVQQYLVNKYGDAFLKEKGLKVYTTLDLEMQEEAERIVTERGQINENFHAYNEALVAINPNTGEILSLVGSKDYFGEPYPKNCKEGLDCLFDPQFNVASSVPGRQPGSAFKPFVYVAAFEKGYDDKTMVVDEETNFGNFDGKDYIPQNYDGRFRGPVTLRQALAQSLNIPSIKVLVNFVGLQDAIQTATDMGITTLKNPSNYGPSLVLGGGEVRLVDMVSAYGVLATEGLRVPLFYVSKIIDSDGNIIEENKRTLERVLDIAPCKLINDILSDNEARAPIFGSSSMLYVPGYKVSAKTGTTGDYRDGWAIGYTNSVVVGVWAGNSNNEPMSKEPGVVMAGPIFNQFIRFALQKYPPKN